MIRNVQAHKPKERIISHTRRQIQEKMQTSYAITTTGTRIYRRNNIERGVKVLLAEIRLVNDNVNKVYALV